MEDKKEEKPPILGLGCGALFIIGVVLYLFISFLVQGGWVWLCVILGIVILYLLFGMFSSN